MNSLSNQPELPARLAETELFKRFREAFFVTIGCPVYLDGDDRRKEADAGLPFATVLQVPVELHGRTVAVLSLDPVRLTDGKYATFEAAATAMLDDGCTASDLRRAQQVFQQMPGMKADRYEALQTMLRCFADQLGELAHRLFLQATDAEPPAVRRARQHILSNLVEPLSLEEVARHAGVSPFHFCKIFKRATGLTFTEFVNRSRVERAKELLLKPWSRVTEVAYDVGFQSLSQFNRSFRRVMEESPTEFRSRMKPAGR